MPMTRTQWENLQKRLPEEDRESWASYQASLNQDTNTGSSSSSTATADTSLSDVTGINTLPYFLSEEDSAALQKALAGLDILSGIGSFGLGPSGSTESGDSGNKGDSGDSGNTDSGSDSADSGDSSSGSSSSDDSDTYEDNSSSYSYSNNTSTGTTYTPTASTEVTSVPPSPGGDPTGQEKKPAIKTAPIDTILFDNDSVDTELITDLLFENIGGQEILTIARNDTVNGQDVSYQPIKNLNILQQEYNPNNILKPEKTSEHVFANYPINLSNKIPNVGSGLNNENVYINGDGDLVIELINLDPDEQVEIQVTTSGTIYEVGA